MNQLSWHNIKYSNLWTQELPGNHMQCNKTNVEIQILDLECQWKPNTGIIFLWYLLWNIMDFDIKCIWMPKGCAHIASTESTECPEPRNQGGMIGHPIREIWAWTVMNSFPYVQPVSYLQKWITRKTRFRPNSCIGIYMRCCQVKRNTVKRWSIYWGMHPSIGNSWVPVKNRYIADYCKGWCMLNWCCSFNGSIVISCICDY